MITSTRTLVYIHKYRIFNLIECFCYPNLHQCRCQGILFAVGGRFVVTKSHFLNIYDSFPPRKKSFHSSQSSSYCSASYGLRCEEAHSSRGFNKKPATAKRLVELQMLRNLLSVPSFIFGRLTWSKSCGNARSFWRRYLAVEASKSLVSFNRFVASLLI